MNIRICVTNHHQCHHISTCLSFGFGIKVRSYKNRNGTFYGSIQSFLERWEESIWEKNVLMTGKKFYGSTWRICWERNIGLKADLNASKLLANAFFLLIWLSSRPCKRTDCQIMEERKQNFSWWSNPRCVDGMGLAQPQSTPLSLLARFNRDSYAWWPSSRFRPSVWSSSSPWCWCLLSLPPLPTRTTRTALRSVQNRQGLYSDQFSLILVHKRQVFYCNLRALLLLPLDCPSPPAIFLQFPSQAPG